MIKNVSKITAGALSLAFLATCLASCNDKLGDYMSDANALQIEVVEGTDSISTRATYSGYHTYFTTGDAIGVYAFDGTKYVSSNVKFTKQDDGSWKPESNVVYDPTYTYYAYYPYIASPYTPTADSGDEDTKFANFISDADDKFYKLDQSSEANFTASNLMIATGTFQTGYRVKFTMLHKRGLAIISGNSDNLWYYSTNENAKYECTPVFIGNVPFTNSDGDYHYLVKPNTATSIAGQSFSIPEGKYKKSDLITLAENVKEYAYSTYNYEDEEWSDYTTEKPKWLTVSSNLDNHDYLQFSVTPTATKTTDVVVSGNIASRPETPATLKNATSASNMDLSRCDNSGNFLGKASTNMTTANCYLVHAPGSYMIPLVYGNALIKGETNVSAYHTTSTNGNVLQDLVNHKGDAIYTGNNTTDPWITRHGFTVDGAKLIWQDVKGLVSEVGINNNFLTFTISSDNITEGNAVIAATSEGTVVWSWHIWVTTQTLNDSFTEGYYTVSNVNLGQVSGTVSIGQTYAGLLCKIRATDTYGASVEFQIKQPDYEDHTNTVSYYNPSPYYQWGRKDPELSSIGGYDIDGNVITFTTATSPISIAATIQNPGTHYYASSTWGPYDRTYYNYWDMNQSGTGGISTATVKTIYDPCPKGFCVPTGNLYKGMAEVEDYQGMVCSWDNTYKSLHWTNGGASSFFPALGYRAASYGGIVDNFNNGYYWSASAGSSNSGRTGSAFYFDSNANRQFLSSSRANALPIRPVAEK